jgi:hypothetical protein
LGIGARGASVGAGGTVVGAGPSGTVEGRQPDSQQLLLHKGWHEGPQPICGGAHCGPQQNGLQPTQEKLPAQIGEKALYGVMHTFIEYLCEQQHESSNHQALAWPGAKLNPATARQPIRRSFFMTGTVLS